MDIQTDQLQVIEILRRLNRVFVRSRDTRTLLSNVCETLMTVENYKAVWVAVLSRDKEVLDFEHEGFGKYGSELKSHLLNKGISKCIEPAITKKEPYYIDDKDCGDCPSLVYKENTKTLIIPVNFQEDLLGILTLALKPTHPLSDFERSLLVELSENLGNAINTIQLEQGKGTLSESINRLTKSISGKSAREVLDSFMQNLLVSLDGDYAFIGKLIPGYEDRIRTISVSTSDGIIENFEYTLPGTPCSEVLDKNICCYASGVAEAFPEDIMLKDMGIQAYIGTPLFNSKDEVAGIMVVLKKTPFSSVTLAKYIFQVFASRASSELMRFDTEMRIIDSEHQYQELIEGSKNPVYIIIGRNYALVNKAWLNMFEYSIEEVKSPDFNMRSIVEPEYYDLVDSRINNFLAGISQPFQYEVEAISKSGKKYYLDVSVTYLNWKGKRAAQGVYRNITGAKKKEKELKSRLRAVEKEARLKTTFLANLSEDLMSKLDGFNSLAEDVLLQKEEGYPEYNLAKNVFEASCDMLEYLNDILDISNIDLNQLEFNKEKFQLSKVMKEVVMSFASSAEDKGLKLNCCKKRYNHAIVETDPNRLKQILVNLIGNAVKYTNEGEIHVNYTIRQDDVKISISDTGIGMTPAKLRKIYKSFIDPKSNLSPETNDSGLGLIVTKALIQRMNGKIWIEPNPKGGSVFNFTLPLA